MGTSLSLFPFQNSPPKQKVPEPGGVSTMIQTQIKCYLHKTNFSWMSKWIIYWSLVATPAGCTVRWCKTHDDCNPLVTVTTELLLQRKETGKKYLLPRNWKLDSGDIFILDFEPGSLRDRWQPTHLACSAPSPSEEGN